MKTLLIKSKDRSDPVVSKIVNTLETFKTLNGYDYDVWDYRDYESAIR
jgi:hypothetical protein